MEKTIMLNIKGSHRPSTGEVSTLELSTEGKLLKNNDVYYIEYEESEISGMKGTTTIFSVQDQSVLMERFGKYQAQYFFEKGAKYIGSYATEQGIIQMGIYATKVDHSIGETEGSMDITYQMNIGNRYSSMNDLSLRYKNN